MSDNIRFAISVEPREELTGEETTITQEVLATEIGRTVGGSGSVDVTDYSLAAAVQGYKDRIPNYLEAPDDADTTDISSEATAKFVYIKNTGKAFSSATVLGAELDASLKIMSVTTLIAILAPGEAWFTKDANGGIACTGIHVRTVTNAGADDTDLGTLAVERLVCK